MMSVLRRRERWWVLLLLVGQLFFSSTSLVSAQNIPAERVATGMSLPVFATHAPGDPDRLFILEQRSGPGDDTGRIQILDLNTGAINPVPFLSVPGLDNLSEEQGLLGLAFHPDYQSNGYFYLTESFDGHTDIVRYQVTGSPDLADVGTATPILSYSQPDPCHNGNWIGFGPDGMLYHTSGDGGTQHDGFGNAQNKTTLNGSVVRIDVGADGLADDFPGDPDRNYAIPSTNPFVGEGGGVREELWAIGLRNPWRASFDRQTGDLWIGDTSQDTLEIINFQHADDNGNQGGHNYGWPLREGTIATPTGGVGGPKPPGAVDPIYEYLHNDKVGTIGTATALGHNQGNSVTGGYVYRGPNNALQGKYFFGDFLGDFVDQPIWSIEFDGTEDPLDFDGTQTGSSYINWTHRIIPDAGSIDFISSFGEDHAGNLYVIDYVDGEVFRLEPNFYDADFDLDGDVDEDNFADWEAAFGPGKGADTDADGDSDGLDFLRWQQLFGSEPPPAPDPGAVNWTSGVSGTWSTDAQWSDGVGADPQNAQATFGHTDGWDSSGNIADAAIVIDGTAGATNVVFDSDAVSADFEMNSNGAATGSLTVSGGATLEIRSTTTPDGLWSEVDAALITVTGIGSELSRTHTDPNKNGGAFIFGSWKSAAGQVIDLKVLDQGSVDNEGQMWFGAYDSSEVDLVVTWEVGEGASINNHDALGGGVSLDNTAGAQGEINFIWNYDSAARATDDSTYAIDITGHGGSVTVAAEGIRYQVETAPDVWTSTMKTYQELYTDGRLLSDGSNAAPFGDKFVVLGTPGMDGYTVLSIEGALAGGSNPGDINADGLVNALDAGMMFANFGGGAALAIGDSALTISRGNLNGSFDIDAADAGVLFAAWTGDTLPAVVGSPVPEPTTLCLAVVGFLSVGQMALGSRPQVRNH